VKVEFIVPGVPQGKGRARIIKIAGHSRMMTPEKTVSYESLIAWTAHRAMQGAPLIEGPVSVTLDIDCQVPSSWGLPKKRKALAGLIYPTTRPDADNVLKSIADGLNGIVWKDDVQMVDVVLRKRYSDTPKVRVVVAELGMSVREPTPMPEPFSDWLKHGPLPDVQKALP